MGGYLDLIIFVTLVVIGYVAGRIAEKRHYRSIRQREKQYADLLVFSNRFPPLTRPAEQTLVDGSVVISEDYFKAMVAALQGLIGGRLKSYESLLDRARREAVLRMKAKAHAAGASMIINIKFQTFPIPGSRPKSIRAVELLAYGTALKFV